jgi:hypothetical protein
MKQGRKLKEIEGGREIYIYNMGRRNERKKK